MTATQDEDFEALSDLSPTHALSDRELIALIIGKRAGKHMSDDIGELANATYPELVAQGLKEAEALRILACFELARRSRAKPAPKALHTPEDAYNLVMPLIDAPHREHFVVVVLDVRNRPRGIARVGTGSVDHCLVDPREVFAPAIRHSGTAVLLVHNHPSGDPTPSIEDIELTQRLAHAGDLISMPILDHLIIGTGPHVNEERKFVSLAEIGHMRAGRFQTDDDADNDDAPNAKPPAQRGRKVAERKRTTTTRKKAKKKTSRGKRQVRSR